MLIVHAYVIGPSGLRENGFDFIQMDGKDGLNSKEVLIPYDKDLNYPLTELDALHFVTVQPVVVPLKEFNLGEYDGQ